MTPTGFGAYCSLSIEYEVREFLFFFPNMYFSLYFMLNIVPFSTVGTSHSPMNIPQNHTPNHTIYNHEFSPHTVHFRPIPWRTHSFARFVASLWWPVPEGCSASPRCPKAPNNLICNDALLLLLVVLNSYPQTERLGCPPQSLQGSSKVVVL